MATEGTPFRRIRIDDDLWERFDDAVHRADPDANRSVVLRKFTRWYVGDIDELPQRPSKRKAVPEGGSAGERGLGRRIRARFDGLEGDLGLPDHSGEPPRAAEFDR